MDSWMIGVVIPTYNERENVVVLIKRLHRVFEEHGIRYRFIIVDDNSPDGTAEAVRELAETIPGIKVIVREKKAGIGSAIKRGMSEALTDPGITHILTMDADLSHRPEDFANFIPFIGKADLVQGSRYVEGGGVVNWGLHRRVISRVANFLVEALYHVGVREHTTNYRLYSRRAAELVVEYAESSGYEFVIEALLIIHAFRLRIVEVPIVFVNRMKGKSKLGFGEIVRWWLFIIGYRRKFRELRRKATSLSGD